MPTNYSATAALLLWSPVAVSNAGCTGAGPAPSSYGKHFTNRHSTQSRTHSGHKSIMNNSALRENAATPRSAHSRSNGFASCFAAGRSASRTMRWFTRKLSRLADRKNILRLNLWNWRGKMFLVLANSRSHALDGRPQILRTAPLRRITSSVGFGSLICAVRLSLGKTE